MPELGASTGEAPAATLPELERIDARQKRIDEVGAKLLSELKGAPKAVRDFVQRPEETIAVLGAASKELARRERELRALLPAAEDARLAEERRALAARVDAEADDIARGRLGAALQALDGSSRSGSSSAGPRRASRPRAPASCTRSRTCTPRYSARAPPTPARPTWWARVCARASSRLARS